MVKTIVIACSALAMLASATFSNCAGRNKSANLPQRVQAYHKCLRWGDINGASYFAADKEDFDKKVKNAEHKMEVIDFEILAIKLNADKKEAVVEVKRQYIIKPSVTVNTQVLEQKWKYDDERKDWYLLSPY